jgi:hypothetical protein
MVAFANLEKEQSKNKVPESLWLVRSQKYLHVLHVVAELRFVSTMTGVTTCIDLLHAINHAKDLFFIHSSFLVGMAVHACRDLVETQIRLNDPKNANNSLQSLYPLAVVAEQVIARACDVCSIESGAISAMLQSARFVVDHAEWMHRSHAAVVLHDNACTRAISILNSIVNIVKSVSDSDPGANEPHLCRYISALALALLSGSAKAKDPIVILDEAEAQIDDSVKVAASVCGQDTKEYELCLKDQIVLFEKCGRRDEAAEIRAHLSTLSKSPYFSIRDNLRRLQIQMAQSFRAAAGEGGLIDSSSGGFDNVDDSNDYSGMPQVMRQSSAGMFSASQPSATTNYNNHAVVNQYVEDTLPVARAADGKLSVESKSSALVRKASSRALVAQMRREAKMKQQRTVRDNVADRERNAKEAAEREFNDMLAMLDAEEKSNRMAVVSREGKSLLKLPFLFWPQLINLEYQRTLTVHDALRLRVALSAIKPFVIARLSRDFVAWKTERKAQQRARVLQAVGRGFLCRHDCGVARVRAAERRKAVAKRVESNTKTTVSSRVLELLAARTIARCMAGYRARLHLFIRKSARSMGLNHLIPQNHYLINSASYNTTNTNNNNQKQASAKKTSPSSQSQTQQLPPPASSSPRKLHSSNRPNSSGSADGVVVGPTTTTTLLNAPISERIKMQRQKRDEERQSSPVMKGRRGGGAAARSMDASIPDRLNPSIMLVEAVEDEHEDRQFLQDAEDARFLKMLEKFFTFFDDNNNASTKFSASPPPTRGTSAGTHSFQNKNNSNNNNTDYQDEDQQQQQLQSSSGGYGSFGNGTFSGSNSGGSPRHGRRSMNTTNPNFDDEGLNNSTKSNGGRRSQPPAPAQQQPNFAASAKSFAPSLLYPRPPGPAIGGWLKDLEKTPGQALRENQQQFAFSTRPNRGASTSSNNDQDGQRNNNNSNSNNNSTNSPQRKLVAPQGNFY